MSRRRRPPRRAFAFLGTVSFVGIGAWTAYEAWTWPDVAGLARRRPATTAFIERYHARQRAAARDATVAWLWVLYAAIAPDLERAVLVAEDINFFSHHGFELGEVKQALGQAVEERERPRGASTITQQLAKNLWLSPARTPTRKLKETIRLRAEATSRRYFGKPAADLSEDEAAQLAASLPSPGTWHPGAESRAYRKHVEAILRRMAKAEFLWRRI